MAYDGGFTLRDGDYLLAMRLKLKRILPLLRCRYYAARIGSGRYHSHRRAAQFSEYSLPALEDDRGWLNAGA